MLDALPVFLLPHQTYTKMSVASIESLIAAKKSALVKARESLSLQLNTYNSMILNLETQIAKLDAELINAQQKPESYAIGTKLKWVSSVNEDTYCVAIVTKKGILEVKNVFEGGGLCHNMEHCTCRSCGTIRLLNSRGIGRKWQPRARLIKTLFATKAEWLNTLHKDGKLTVTPPAVPLYQLRKLMHTPLTATTDALKLKELELRFPGAKFTCREESHISSPYFTGFKADTKRTIMAEWRGSRFQLSHLF